MKTTILLPSVLLLSTIAASDANAGSGAGSAQTAPAVKYELPTLPYGLGDLEPTISQHTMSLHYGKHLQAYVNNLNKLIAGTEFENMSLEDIVLKSEGALFNNAGQTLNHQLYFLSFSPNGGGKPSGALAAAIDAQWGSFEAFRKEFSDKASAIFGSGWAWLSKDNSGKLVITAEPNGSNPVKNGLSPILGFDVWEHAYYVDYENRRAEHIEAIWNILDWNVIGSRY